MKSLTEYLWFETPHRRDYINITDKIEALVKKSGVKEGLVLVAAMHITASVFINDDESGLHQDFDEWLEGLAPQYKDSLKIVKINSDENPKLVERFQVRGIPQLFLVRNGTDVTRVKERTRTRLSIELDQLLD